MDTFEKISMLIFLSGLGILFASGGISLMKISGVF